MTLPATGTTWDGAGFNDNDSRFLERGKLRAALIRDARGSATDISPHDSSGEVAWSPFAQDGKWRGDLLAFKRANGIWIENPDENEGFHMIGAFKDGDGPVSKPNLKNDDFMILQSNFPFDSDLTEEGEPFSFTAVETAKPVIRRLRNNLRLNDPDTGAVLVEAPGLADAGWVAPFPGEPGTSGAVGVGVPQERPSGVHGRRVFAVPADRHRQLQKDKRTARPPNSPISRCPTGTSWQCRTATISRSCGGRGSVAQAGRRCSIRLSSNTSSIWGRRLLARSPSLTAG